MSQLKAPLTRVLGFKGACYSCSGIEGELGEKALDLGENAMGLSEE